MEGASPDQSQQSKDTPISPAAWAGMRAFRGEMPGQAVSLMEAFKAAEAGNSGILAAYLHEGGDPFAVTSVRASSSSPTAFAGWSLLHLASGCSLLSGTAATVDYQARPEPASQDGYATCVSLLIAAGADPTMLSRQGGVGPLAGACLVGDAECCRLLLQAGANPRTLDDFRFVRGADTNASSSPSPSSSSPPSDGLEPSLSPAFAPSNPSPGHATSASLLLPLPLRELEATVGAPHEKPQHRLLPRSPLRVSARLLDWRHFEKGEEGERDDVEVRWQVPPADLMRRIGCGPVQRYVVRAYVKGFEVEVVHAAVGPGSSRRQRRDFCENQVVDRGIALRQHLGLHQPLTASTLINGLVPGLTYHFTVSCVARVQGVIRESPPSLMSKPLDIPSVEEEEWNMGEILDKVMGYGLNNAMPPTATAINATLKSATPPTTTANSVTEENKALLPPTPATLLATATGGGGGGAITRATAIVTNEDGSGSGKNAGGGVSISMWGSMGGVDAGDHTDGEEEEGNDDDSDSDESSEEGVSKEDEDGDITGDACAKDGSKLSDGESKAIVSHATFVSELETEEEGGSGKNWIKEELDGRDGDELSVRRKGVEDEKNDGDDDNEDGAGSDDERGGEEEDEEAVLEAVMLQYQQRQQSGGSNDDDGNEQEAARNIASDSSSSPPGRREDHAELETRRSEIEERATTAAVGFWAEAAEEEEKEREKERTLSLLLAQDSSGVNHEGANEDDGPATTTSRSAALLATQTTSVVVGAESESRTRDSTSRRHRDDDAVDDAGEERSRRMGEQRQQQRLFEEAAADKMRVEQILFEMRSKRDGGGGGISENAGAREGREGPGIADGASSSSSSRGRGADKSSGVGRSMAHADSGENGGEECVLS